MNFSNTYLLNPFMTRISLTVILLALTITTMAQQKILSNKTLMNLVKSGIDKTYNSEFDEAAKIFRQVAVQTPGHPVGPLLFGLYYYYKYMPLTPASEGAAPFEATVNEAIACSERMLDKDKNDVEALALDMISRALLNMYYVDNGSSLKAIMEIMPIYRSVMKGFSLMYNFNEFYFTTGLYNYYREAYPEAHPVYKPIASLLQPGNKILGLKQLNYAADSCIFLKNEALVFLKIIYLNYENDPEKAMQCMQRLHHKYPGNLNFVAGFTETLLMQKEYEKARPHIYQLLANSKKDLGLIMKGLIFKGIYEEKANKDLVVAEKNYLSGLKAAEELGPAVDAFKAYACLGLARIYAIQGKSDKARDYRKKGEGYARYKYFRRLDQP
jgi:tetratricopeptide (TPR) repeat protein